MAGILNNLYPPIIDTMMPSFVRTTACKVYFSLSSYNDAAYIQNVQVTVSNQNSSLTALDPTQYPAGIKITSLNVDTDVESDDRYYITISPSDLKDGIFEINQYYKVQIRFTGTAATAFTDSTKIAPWLTENQGYFSEWSTVCLIKGIQQPLIYIKGFDSNDTSSSTETVFTISELIDIVGSMYYDENEDEDEYLTSYEVNIYDSDGDAAYESGILYTNEYYPNEINHKIKVSLTDSVQYTLSIPYTTNNGYTNTVSYTFITVSGGVDALNVTISAEADNENGRVIISIVSTDTTEFLSNLCIRRTSSESNFTIWEDVYISLVNNGTVLDFTWYDYTVESGIWYTYCAQKINAKGQRGTIITNRYPVMVYLDDIFLTREGMQIKIKYDPSISSFKTTLSESRTETIGSKYPFIRRNGNVAYRQFPISGLITAFMDEDGIFISKDSTFGDNLEYYEDYNEENLITDYNNFIYEREFREQVMDFLYANKAILFRSLSEGNILIRLMDVSFTPNSTLGRMIYSFSATAYEIDECSLDNFTQYGIQTVGEYSSYIEYSYDSNQQLTGTISAGTNALSLIQKELNLSTNSGYLTTLYYLKWLRLEFESDPYLIVCGIDGSLTPATADDEVTDNTVYGYIVYINDEAILVSARGYYELLDSDTEVYSVSFPVDTQVSLDYIGYISEEEDKSSYASRLYYYVRAGQLWGVFDVNTSLYKQIYTKYYVNYTAYYQGITSIDRVTIESSPGAVVYLKDSFDDDYYRHVVGPTGILDFYDDDATISAFYFCGMHLNPMKDTSRLEPEDGEYYDTGITVSSLDEITKPIKNGVYTVAETASTEDQIDAALTAVSADDNTITVEESETVYDADAAAYTLLLSEIVSSSSQYIYYRSQWYVFTSDGDVLCPVEGLVNYIYELVKGEY